MPCRFDSGSGHHKTGNSESLYFCQPQYRSRISGMTPPSKTHHSIKPPVWLTMPAALLLLLAKTILLRIEIQDPHGHLKGSGLISVIWHNRLLFSAIAFPRPLRKKTVAVVSPSRDGQYVASLLSHFGTKSLRGSSSRQGARALRAAFQALEKGFNVCFTPDGPRGPKYRMSRGPIHLASRSGRPIVPLTLNASRYWALKSWDNFQIPKPFSRLTVILGEAVTIPPELDEEELENWRQIIEDKLMSITVD